MVCGAIDRSEIKARSRDSTGFLSVPARTIAISFGIGRPSRPATAEYFDYYRRPVYARNETFAIAKVCACTP